MTFSYSLPLALLLLAPGFGAYFGLFSATQHARFQPSPPAPNSVLTLGLVVIGATCAHAAFAALYSVIDFGMERGWWRWSLLPYVRSPYAILFSTPVDHLAVSNRDAAVFLGSCLLLSALAALTTVALIRSDLHRGAFGPLLYGWLQELVEEASDPDTYVNAFILTDIQNGDLLLGYEGTLENLTLSSDKDITAVLLKQVKTFYVRLEDAAVVRVPVPRESTIPQIYFEKAQIKNIAFVPYVVVEEFSSDAVQAPESS